MKTETATTLRLSRVVPADPARVFQAWTEPAQLLRWSCPEGGSVEDAQVDLRVGGAFRIRMKTEAGVSHTAFGTYRVIEPPHRLVYTWDWAEEGHRVGETLLTIELNPVGGGTEVVLTHELFPNAEAKTAHQQGWISCLNRLERLMRGGTP